MSARRGRCVYGPVPSRRLGRSLGIDIVPFKTCSYDCIYCQLGHTTNKTIELREYVPLDGVYEELAVKLRLDPSPDFIALAGSGEPTLHAGIGDLIAGIKRMAHIPVAVLTNGSLLWMPEVRAGLAEADLVLPSLDAGSRQAFERVNRPHPGISFEKMTAGLAAFLDGFRGKTWLEVFVVGGITDLPDEMSEIASIANRLRPARVQLNTATRPPAEDYALAVPVERLEEIKGLFEVPCEVIAEYRPAGRVVSAADRNAGDEIVALLSRRPCTVEGISAGLNLPPNEVIKHLNALTAAGAVRSERRGGEVYYEGSERP
jgi:wyosine [tRNA(Phe)-imidazoG37] synthetase (radical SAM superfamily)